MQSQADVSWRDRLFPPPHLARYARAGVYRERTIGDLARDRAMAEPDAPVFLGLEGWTVGRIVADAEALLAALQALGVRPGEAIASQLPNWPEAAVVNLACAIGGFVIAPIVHIYRDLEVGQMLADSRARAFFVAEHFRRFGYADMIERLRPRLEHLAYVAFVRSDQPGSFEALVEAGRGRSPTSANVDPNAVKMLLYTSGTTGRPKGVLHSHNTLMRVSDQAVARWGIVPGDAILMPSPVGHISGFTNGLELPFQAGTRTVLMEAWDAEQACDLIEAHGVAGTVAATPFLQELATIARARGSRLPSMRFFACGGAAVSPDLVRAANAAFAQPIAFRVFGASEVPLVTLGFPRDAELAATTDGEIIDYEVRIVDDGDANVPSGNEGEILARGPSMLLGYADLDDTAAAITADGFFRTGDLGRVSAAHALTVTGRKKDLIIRGGENISAREIEDVLTRHPGVAEAAVVGMPHPRLGEGVCAFLIACGPPPDVATLAAFVADSGLARQKTPERFEWLAALPRTASGKVRKDQLRQIAASLQL
jgi:acyl-CoA synthetase (AMP-forming)/AMP-acid ligase II